jgi:Ni/Fe-hydrogenase subunit HybB-like protein
MSTSTYTASLESPWGRQVERDLMATLEPMGRRGQLWVGGLVALTLLGFVAYTIQVVRGLQVTAMTDYVSWGLYMTNFVFFIGISHAGTLISAILRVTNADWRRPITRMAEAITAFALMVGASMVIIDLGRPDRVLNVFLYGRMQSPILWDVFAITTYLTGSVLYLYIAMIPDMPILARRAEEQGRPAWVVRCYKALALGYRGTHDHEQKLNRALAAMAVIIIPVAVSVHTVVSWVFGMTIRPGWHSTIFGPYFVVGAVFSGTAAIITAMAVFRWAYGLERYLTLDHFRKLSAILLALTLLYIYFTLSEYLTVWFGGLEHEAHLLTLLMGQTAYGWSFWAWVAFGLFVPFGLLLMPSRRSLGAIVTASVLINIGMYVKRYLIVVPTMKTPHIPAEAAGETIVYFPNLIEWSITLGALAFFLLLFTLFSRAFPIVSIWEAAEEIIEPDPEPATERPRSAVPVGAIAPLWLLLAGGLALAAALPTSGHAQELDPASARVELEKAVEGGEEVLLATVTTGGVPLEGARVAFLVRRTFGEMPLGEDITLSDGTAAVSLPPLPGDANGDLIVLARVLSPFEFEGAGAAVVVSGGIPVAAEGAASQPRTLWSSRAPIAMTLSILAMVLIVWSVYFFAVVQLVGISRTSHAE